MRPERSWWRQTKQCGATSRRCRNGLPDPTVVEPGESTCGSCSRRWPCSAPRAVEAVQCERNELDGSGGVAGTGEMVTLPAQLLLRSVGYRGLPLPGVPFDERSGVIPHVDGRVQRNGCTAAGEYVVGWIKRGPTGVIGTNKSDAKETVERLLHDLDALPRAPHREPEMIIERLARQGVGVVTWAGWEAIDTAEQALGVAAGRTRIKIASREALLIAAGQRGVYRT